MAMVSQMQIASNKATAATLGQCGIASCGSMDTTSPVVLSECVNLANAATENEDYILIEGAFSLDTTTPGSGGRYAYLDLR